MGKLANLSLVLPVLAALFSPLPKLATSGQIVVASLSATFISIAFRKTRPSLRATYMTPGYQLQQNVLCPVPPPLSNSAYAR